ncbi:hypothetical protein AVEN_224384-1 [Araneus ventricosus]|uniref:Uncharacterized protein n=1 Tax=Araneus ventricosus TaxID=182803 RepID=A0A4Y2R7H8_ARAVE|nr:hypothetical protein AVEN_224384-1 [Araneus ventricosus]
MKAKVCHRHPSPLDALSINETPRHRSLMNDPRDVTLRTDFPQNVKKFPFLSPLLYWFFSLHSIFTRSFGVLHGSLGTKRSEMPVESQIGKCFRCRSEVGVFSFYPNSRERSIRHGEDGDRCFSPPVFDHVHARSVC